MADQHLVKILKEKGPEVWNAWRKEYSAHEIDLSVADLRGADLQSVNLYGVNLRGADLREANLPESILQGANLYSANLQKSNLQNANLYAADLRTANLQEANLYRADLRRANFWYTNLYRTNLEQAKVDENFAEAQHHPEKTFIGTPLYVHFEQEHHTTRSLENDSDQDERSPGDESSHNILGYERSGYPILASKTSHEFLEKSIKAQSEEHLSTAAARKRVLNACFEATQGQYILKPTEALQPGADYDLLIQVGPAWESIQSLLGQQAFFTEDSKTTPYLSQKDREKGWFDLEAIFVSQQFHPSLTSGRIRVLTDTMTSSIPYLYGRLENRPAPLKLRMRAPISSEDGRAHGRLSLYYGAQALQSAIISVAITARIAENERNLSRIDYILASEYQHLNDIATRQRTSTGQNEHIKFGILMNDDHSGSHRILIKGDSKAASRVNIPPAWKAYDSQSISYMLEEARQVLLNPSGKSFNFDKDTFLFEKFRDDLFALAKLGSELYSTLLLGITPDGNITPQDWRDIFNATLKPGDVIQLARAGSVPSTHVIPWALVYQGHIEADRSDLPLNLCPVVEEQWDMNFLKRKQPYRNQESLTCPYESQHKRNTVCPFEFWGYKYTLEQPISAIKNNDWDLEPARHILADNPVKMAIAATTDIPRKSRHQQHFKLIHDFLNASYIPVIPATERDQFRDSLREPQLIYILCHGSKDKKSLNKKTHLNIGPRSEDARYTITPDLPGRWCDLKYIDKDKWKKNRPLVFINGCYTTDLLPELTLDFVSAFRDLLAGGVIGTEIPVKVEHGYQAAEKFFERLGRGQDVGQAILGMRWDLLNQGSFLGLAYTPYGMSDLKFKR